MNNIEICPNCGVQVSDQVHMVSSNLSVFDFVSDPEICIETPLESESLKDFYCSKHCAMTYIESLSSKHNFQLGLYGCDQVEPCSCCGKDVDKSQPHFNITYEAAISESDYVMAVMESHGVGQFCDECWESFDNLQWGC